MKTWRPIPRPRPTRVRRALAVAAVATLAMTSTALLTASPASAGVTCPNSTTFGTSGSTGTLCNVSLAVSNNAVSGSSTLYTWAFTTASAGTLTQLTFTVPSGTTATSPSVTVSPAGFYGLVKCTPGTVSLDTGTPVTVKLLLSCTGSTDAGTPVAVAMSGFTNTPTPSTSEFDSTVTTYAGTSANPTILDQAQVPSGQTPAAGIEIASNATGVKVVVPESLTFTNGGPSKILLLPIPGTPATNNQVQLKVATNAASGYTLSACLGATGLSDSTYSGSGTTPSISSVPPGSPAASPLSGSAFGAMPTSVSDSSGNSTGGTGHLNSGAWATTTYSGYPETCDGSSDTDKSVILYNTVPTGGDEVTMTNAASVSSTQAGGTYTGTITYVVTPSY